MEETGISTQQSSFGADGGGSSTPSAASDAPVSSAETSTNHSSASDGGGGSTPPSTATQEADNTVAQSEHGSFKLVYNKMTGRNEVVSTMPTESEEKPAPQQQQAPAATNTYNGNELMQAAQQVANNPLPKPPDSEYSMPELQEAIRQGNVDENRIPVDMRQNYYLAMAQQQQAAQPQSEPAQAQEPVADTAKAQEFYGKVQQMAQERAMKEIGITQDEIDVAEYTDDPELIKKANAYKVAIENNRAQILQDVDNIQRQQKAVEEDRIRAYQTIVNFVDETRKKEPNFDAIDRLMTSRVAQMPYEKAIKIVPLLNKIKNNTLSTADLPALQDMYNETRLEFYSQREGVDVAPQVQRPAYVETPGSGKEAPKQFNSVKDLGKLSKRDKIRAIGQMFGSSFLEDN